jgi:hypothetical protein
LVEYSAFLWPLVLLLLYIVVSCVCVWRWYTSDPKKKYTRVFLSIRHFSSATDECSVCTRRWSVDTTNPTGLEPKKIKEHQLYFAKIQKALHHANYKYSWYQMCTYCSNMTKKQILLS